MKENLERRIGFHLIKIDRIDSKDYGDATIFNINSDMKFFIRDVPLDNIKKACNYIREKISEYNINIPKQVLYKWFRPLLERV